MEFSNDQLSFIQHILRCKHDPSFVSKKIDFTGNVVLYVDCWKLIAVANEIFGFNGWSHSIIDQTVDFLDHYNGRYYVGVTSHIRVELKNGTYHEDIGYGTSEGMTSKGLSLEKAKKESVSDGFRRALKFFGNIFGNCLDDKIYREMLQTFEKNNYDCGVNYSTCSTAISDIDSLLKIIENYKTDGISSKFNASANITNADHNKNSNSILKSSLLQKKNKGNGEYENISHTIIDKASEPLSPRHSCPITSTLSANGCVNTPNNNCYDTIDFLCKKSVFEQNCLLSDMENNVGCRSSSPNSFTGFTDDMIEKKTVFQGDAFISCNKEKRKKSYSKLKDKANNDGTHIPRNFCKDDSALWSLYMKQQLAEAQEEEDNAHIFAQSLGLTPCRKQEKFQNQVKGHQESSKSASSHHNSRSNSRKCKNVKTLKNSSVSYVQSKCLEFDNHDLETQFHNVTVALEDHQNRKTPLEFKQSYKNCIEGYMSLFQSDKSVNASTENCSSKILLSKKRKSENFDTN